MRDSYCRGLYFSPTEKWRQQLFNANGKMPKALSYHSPNDKILKTSCLIQSFPPNPVIMWKIACEFLLICPDFKMGQTSPPLIEVCLL